MFGALAKSGALLSFDVFCKLSFGSKYKEFESVVKQASGSFNQCLELELMDNACLDNIASIHDFDPDTAKNAGLTQNTISELIKFSIANEWQDEKIKIATLQNDIYDYSEMVVTPQARGLVRQYLAYKVAFLNFIDANEDMIFNALVLN